MRTKEDNHTWIKYFMTLSDKIIFNYLNSSFM